MKISEAALADVKEACGIYEDSSDSTLENLYMPAAKAFMLGYTGLSTEQLDEHEDLTTAYFVLINDMYSQKDYTVSRETLNPCVKTILNMHSINNIG